ncbi:MAG: PEP-CTERM sorting domain-containing protein [Akkermansiaceae bacterium]
MKTIKANPFIFTSALFSALSLTSHAQLVWDPDADQVNNGGAGTWDTATLNWDDDASAPNVAWTNGSSANFGNSGGNYVVDVANGGVTVGDLTYGGGGKVSFRSVTDNLGLISIASGGATWDTGGGEIEFLNIGLDTPVSISSGDTLAVTGGGTFDTGERPNGANWTGSGATLDVASGVSVRGHAGSIGQISTVKLDGGARYFHERNADQGYANNWELGAGTVAFDNRFARNYTLNGDISGAGRFKVEFMGNRQVILNGVNTFTGGIEVSNASRMTVDSDSIGTGDLVLSGSTATNGGILRLSGNVALGNRTLTLNGTGGYIVNAGVNSLDGNITGSGNLQIGNAAFADNTNVLTLNGTADHTGATTIFKGSLQLGANNALSSASVVNIGGNNGGTSDLRMNGFDAEIGGLRLTTGGSNTRVISNNGGSTSTLTINVTTGGSHDYAANVSGADRINIVKSGDGTQIFGRNGGYTTAFGDVTVTGGELVWNNNTATTIGGLMTVATGGTLGGNGAMNSLHFGSDALLDLGLAGAGELLTLDDTATLTFDDFDFDNLVNSTWQTDGVGTYTLINGDFTLDPTNLAHFGEENALDRGDGNKIWFIDGSLGYEVAPIPEPSTVLLSALAALSLLGRRRK